MEDAILIGRSRKPSLRGRHLSKDLKEGVEPARPLSERRVPGKGNSKCKVPGVVTCLVCALSTSLSTEMSNSMLLCLAHAAPSPTPAPSSSAPPSCRAPIGLANSCLLPKFNLTSYSLPSSPSSKLPQCSYFYYNHHQVVPWVFSCFVPVGNDFFKSRLSYSSLDLWCLGSAGAKKCWLTHLCEMSSPGQSRETGSRLVVSGGSGGGESDC